MRRRGAVFVLLFQFCFGGSAGGDPSHFTFFLFPSPFFILSCTEIRCV